MRVGVLTGGGDCPGLNAVLRALVRTMEDRYGGNVVGYRHGWRGVGDSDSVELTGASTHAILATGGTILGTSRHHPEDHDGATERVLETVRRDRVDALVVIGGDGTLASAARVAELGVPIIGIPKTIDNDVRCTERSVGFDTAVGVATEAVDRIHTTAESHDRLMVVEVMGHQSGWLAIAAGIGGGAHAILIPERPVDLPGLAAALVHRHRRESFSIVIVAEGAQLHGDANASASSAGVSAGEHVRRELAARTGFESRVVVLGHVQRGGVPTPTDRILGTRFGVAAADAANSGASDVMTALAGDEIVLVDLCEVARGIRTVSKSWIDTADAFLA